MIATTQGKAAALAALAERRAHPSERIDNARLPAGSPMYYYCISCPQVAVVMPESHTSKPPKLCPECQALKDLGWLE